MPTRLSPVSVTEDNADAEQEEQKKNSEGGR